MRRIQEEEAVQLIKAGIFPKCKVAKDTFIPVKTLIDLKNLKDLAEAKVQSFELYHEDSVENSLPEDAVELSIDSAFILLYNKEKVTVKVYCKNNGKETEVSNTSQLTSLIRQFNTRGENFVLYRK